jgi:uncharacterized repeat protein (TIGR01451 family)
LYLEPLEERILLDSGLPPALVVGRTLSSYTTTGIQSNQETLTFTVYNEQADPVSGVLLTDTLQPGVTFQSASQLPDQSGQNLAWSLGTIQGFDRASVTLTVSLANPVPLQLDAGAHAFGTLDAGAVTADTPAATLTTRTILADQLASTPDANTTDPFVQEQAAKLRYDPQTIFSYLNTQVGYNSYTGSLRGARGTLWSSAGNALDVASLGVALMRASGIPAQYVSGTLSKGQAQQLILSMFPASFQTVGYIPAGTQTADPANDPQLLSETESHYWFQFDAGSGLKDADPLMSSATLGQTFTTVTGTFTEVPDNLRAKTEIKLTAELYYPFFAGLIGALQQLSGGSGIPGTSQTVVLDRTFNDVDLVGRPLTIGNFVDSKPIPTIFAPVTNTYTPYIVVGDEALHDSQLPEAILGQPYQEILSGFPLANQILTGLFLNVTLNSPGTSSQTYTRTLVDRIGYAARQGMAPPENLSVNPSGPPIITPYDLTTLNILPGLQSPGAAQLAQERAAQELASISSESNPTPVAQAQALTSFARSELASFAVVSDKETANLARGSSVTAYFNAPRITAFSSQFVTRNNQSSISFGFDLMRDSVRAIASPGQNVLAPLGFAGARGIIDSVLESQTLPPGGQNLSAAAILQESMQRNIAMAVVNASNINLLQRLPLPTEAVARITAEVQTGLTVIVPTQAVTMDGLQTAAWYTINPETGEMIAESQNGGHQGLTTYLGVTTAAIILLSPLVLNAGLLALSHYAHVSNHPTVHKVAAITALVLAGLEGIIPFLGIYYTAANTALGIAFVLAELDPPLPPETINLNVPFSSAATDTANTTTDVRANEVAGQVAATIPASGAVASGQLAASWSSATTSSLLASSLGATGATIVSSQGTTLGSGTVALSTQASTTVSVSGNLQYSVNGTGSLSFSGPAESSLGVSGNWDNYSATVSGNVSITLTVPADALTLNGKALPAGEYTITTNSATLSGRGPSTSPNFSESASITTTNGTINLGPSSGNIIVGGNALDLTSGATLTGYTGSITMAAGGGNNLDNVTLNGNTTDVVTVLAIPSTLATDQNRPVTFKANVNTSFADTYTLTAQAPPGWAVTIDNNGKVTATPAPGLQGGTYPIQVIAQSGKNPDLVAQTTVKVTITPTQPGISFTVSADPVFTIPFDGAQVPTAFQAVIHNNGPTPDTFNLTFSNVPAGFTLLKSGMSVTIPAGRTGIVGLYLKPNGTQPIPAAGTQLSFTVTATSASNPTITQTQTESFTMPAVDAVTVVSSAVALNTTPGADVTTTLTLTNVGNVPETVSLAATLPTGLTASSLTPVTLAVGQSTTETLTLTPAASTPLNSTLAATVTATFGPSTALVTQTVQVSVQVIVPGAQAVANASVAAGQLGNTGLANRLNDLSTALTNLVQDPTSDVYKSQSLASIDSILSQFASDAFQATFTPALTSARTALAAAGTAADVQAAVKQLGTALGTLATTLSDEAAHGFSLGLLPNTGVALPNAPAVFDIVLQNAGTAATTYDFSVSGLPANVTATFSQPSITLNPGDAIPNGSNRVTLSLSEAGTQLFATGFSVTVTPEGASELVRIASGSLTLRSAFVEVTEVDANPAFVAPGGQVQVSARVLNAVNQVQQGQVAYTVTDANGNTVFSSAPVPVTLNLQASLVTVNLGTLDTTGFAKGNYTLNVTVTDAAGHPLPGSTGHGTLLVGSPVTATLSVSPTTLPPGNGTVTNTLTLNFAPQVGTGVALLGQVADTSTPWAVAVQGTLAYVAASNGIDIVDVSDPTNPKVLSTFGQNDVAHGGNDLAKIVGNQLLVASQNSGSGWTFLIYSLANPQSPQLLSNSSLGPAFMTDLDATSSTALVSSNVVYFFPGNVVGQGGDLTAIDFSNPNQPVLGSHLSANTIASPPAGQTRQLGVAVVNSQVAYVASSTSTGGQPPGQSTTVGEGRVLVVNIQDPKHVQEYRLPDGQAGGSTELDVPGTTYLFGIGVEGNHALVVGVTGGINANLQHVGNATLTVLDISDPLNPHILKTVVTPNTLSGEVLVRDLGNNQFAVTGIQLNGKPVLEIVDISSPSSPAFAAIPVADTLNGGITAADGKLYVTSSSGLSIFNVAPLLSAPLTLDGQVQTTATAGSVALDLADKLAYVGGTGGIDIVDISNPTSPVDHGTFGQSIAGAITLVRLDTIGGTNYLIVGTTGNANAGQYTLLVYSLASPLAPALVGSTTVPYEFLEKLIVQGTTVLTPMGGLRSDGLLFGSLESVDVSNPAAPHLADVLDNSLGTPYGGTHDVSGGVFINSTTAYVGTTTETSFPGSGVGQILVVDASDPNNLKVLDTVNIPGMFIVRDVAVQGNRALVVGEAPVVGGVRSLALAVLDISNPLAPVQLGSTLPTGATLPGGTFRFFDQSLGNGLFAVSPAVVNNKPALLVVDPTDPNNIAVLVVSQPAQVNEMAVAGNLLYATSANGLAIYTIGAVASVPVTASVEVPKNTGVATVSGSFSSPPSQVISGADFDTLVWKRAFAFGATSFTFTWQSTVSNLQPGEARPVTLGTTVNFTSQGTPGTLSLPPTAVAAAQVLGLTPPAQTVAPAAAASYDLNLQNPTGSPVTYTLSVQGVPAGWIKIAPTVTVAANGSADVMLTLTSDELAALGAYGFTITAAADTGYTGTVQGMLTLAGTPAVQPDLEARGVVLGLTPASASAGQGTSATFTIQVTNTGSATDTFALTLSLPPGVAGKLSQASVTVPPGAGNFRDVTLTLTAQPGTAAASLAFSLAATSTSKPAITSAAAGTLNVLATGVGATLTPASGALGTTYQLTVTNTGQVADTFDLSLAGPAALVATLGTNQVTLAPGASQTVPITTSGVNFAVPGALNLTGIAQSHTNPAVQAAASAALTIPTTSGLTADLNPPNQALATPGPASFQLQFHNTGNAEDSYSVTITGTSGPVTAFLVGLDGQPTQRIAVVRLPGLASGALQLQTSLTGGGTGTVAVQIQSLSNPALVATVTATVTAPTVTVPNGWLRQVYLDLFNRVPDPQGQSVWTAFLDAGQSRIEVAAAIESSGPTLEFRDSQVQDVYRRLLGRPAEPDALENWAAFLEGGGTVEQFTAAVAGSPEYFQKQGGTTDGFLQALYHDLLGRDIDPTGRTNLTQALAQGASGEQVAAALLDSDEYRAVLVGALYQRFLHRAPDSLGAATFEAALRGGMRDEEVIADILGSPEYYARAVGTSLASPSADQLRSYVSALYQRVLGRAPDAAGLSGWVSFLQGGGTRADAARAFWESAEHRGLEVDALYAHYLHRAADADGRAVWVNALLAGVTEAEVVSNFLASPEYVAAHPDSAAFAAGLYNDVLGRPGAAAEVAMWQAQLDGGLSRAAAAAAFLASPEGYRHTLDNDYANLLGQAGQDPGEAALVAALVSGQRTPAQVAEGLLASDEFFTKSAGT